MEGTVEPSIMNNQLLTTEDEWGQFVQSMHQHGWHPETYTPRSYPTVLVWEETEDQLIYDFVYPSEFQNKLSESTVAARQQARQKALEALNLIPGISQSIAKLNASLRRTSKHENQRAKTLVETLNQLENERAEMSSNIRSALRLPCPDDLI